MGILWIIILVVIIIWGWSYLKKQKEVDRPRDSALDILEQRYARGEISKEEFEEKKKDLTGI